ncbi:MAG: glycosyltransferase [Candidatus Buchananbacteria bacterium]
MKVLIVLPVYNEQEILALSLEQLVDFCHKNLTEAWQIIIADNDSTDQTAVIAQELSIKYQAVSYMFVPQKGKGLAIRTAWQKFRADVYIFMDVDLATGLEAVPVLIKGIASGYEVVVGSRFLVGSKVIGRNLLRRLTSIGYSLLTRLILNLKTKDAPCGFKAINERVKREILPLVENNEWFFDTELLIKAQQSRFKILEIPVIWRESKRPSKVSTFRLSWQYLRQIVRLFFKIKR